MIHIISRWLCTWAADQSGQDLIEYSLLLAFVALAAAGLILGAGSNLNGAWDEGSELLHSANTTAGS
jgi:Flp pilus assembly pilin Flp